MLWQRKCCHQWHLGGLLTLCPHFTSGKGLAFAEASTQCYSMDAVLETICKNAYIIWEENA